MRKMLCLLLLLAMLTPCLPALAEDTDALDVILLSSASIEPLQETLRPGKAVTLRFTSPVDGTVTLLLRNAETLETVLPVAKDYPVTAGENQMLWNGTYEGVFAPEGDPTGLWRSSPTGQKRTPPFWWGRLRPS